MTSSHDDNEAPASETVAPQEDDDWVRVVNKKKTAKSERKHVRNRWMRPKEKEINGFEMEELSEAKKEQDGRVWITVDSGASENVISEKMAHQFEVKPSKGSRGEVKYVTPIGSLMNEEEKDVKVRTKEWHTCVMTMQVIDVQKPLMNVSRICDACHGCGHPTRRRVHRARDDRTQHRVRVRGQSVPFEASCSAIKVSAGRGDECRVCRECFPSKSV